MVSQFDVGTALRRHGDSPSQVAWPVLHDFALSGFKHTVLKPSSFKKRLITVCYFHTDKARTPMAEDGPENKKTPPQSMSMIEPRLRNIYLSFYKESYFKPSALDLKTKELIAIGCSLVAKCEGCLEGHLKKALELGLTKDEISDAIAIAVGIAAAGIVDFSDKAAIKLDLHHFE